ncbi:MAG: hypothetical protein PW734_08175 [Verrucomicrobium sp.]|nr:hypothetical protein [Verrucomicrobium sp.]
MSETAFFIRRQAAKITPLVLEKLLPKLPMLKMEFTQIKSPEFPHLFEQLEFLADVVEDFAEGADKEIPYTTVAEAAFAILFVHRHLDILPDDGDGHGQAHATDSSVVRNVIQHHQAVLSAYAARHQMAWNGAITKP